jgi:hypothetical protein
MVAGRVARRADALRRLVRPRGLVVALVGPGAATGRLVEGLVTSGQLPVRSYPAGQVPGGWRIRRDRGAGLVVLVAPTLDEMPAWRLTTGPRRTPAGLKGLFNPGLDLVIRLDTGPSTADRAQSGSRPSSREVQVVDASVSPDELRRAVSAMIWRRLLGRWTGRDARRTNDR